MAVADYKRYLAENVLNERRTVTFRSLSRALRVHSTLAKQMLYDFHRNENSKRPQSVNATYIVTGVQKAPAPATNGHINGEENGGDVFPSSPYLSSSMPNQDSVPDTVPTASVLLVREEDLEDAKSTFESISSIYIYSLQQTVLQDLNVLTDVSREMVSNHSQEDPLEYGGQWGMIQNKNVKRRTGARPAPAPAAATSKPTIPSKRPSEATSSQTKPEPTKEESAVSEQVPTQESTSTTSKATQKAAPVKREKSNLFSSFAKAKPKQKKEESATPAESAEPSGAEDVFGDDDDADEEPEELFPDSGKSASSAAATRESRKEREEKLKQMMEDDDEDEDEEMPDATEPPEESKPIDQPAPKKPELKEEIIVQGGRRRGRRQVMKKQVRKDDEGYLVTVEEPSWESFSEDEPAPPPKKKPAVSAPKGKSAGKGQGNIMSFFGKK
ncbi:DNA polymerase subunit Cdc27 [Aspergillus pseudotamarii]|uniref:DNA polymerase delta subunit 3 n=1 Tax=Aspergillus pseudotamarii TaxID=132259 RepID=A0A5N6SL37_ASPPS|nr:DNA polymerase subunit Cdc27 [Aspergillus pseudotamarii]KAE8134411.1 DNA polymerase subunit Cdc27 [Aspergillus pseudotamarii]